MAEASNKQECLRQNLLDAGCDRATMEACIALAGECRTAELLRLLGTQKRALLKTVHESQKCIDCLDYLVYQIERGSMI